MDIVNTTVNFESTRYETILKLSSKSGINFNKLIIVCVRKLSLELRKKTFQKGARKYQPKGYDYEPVPFQLSEDEYDFFDDLQKHSRLCFSLLVALSLDKFADEVIRLWSQNSYKKITYEKRYFHAILDEFYVFSWKIIEKTKKRTERQRE
jgi:hypothetical protein